MWQRNPGTFPQKTTDAGYRKDPMGSVPFPYPSGMPAAVWNVAPLRLDWVTAGLPTGVFAAADRPGRPFAGGRFPLCVREIFQRDRSPFLAQKIAAGGLNLG